jgi:hypothetical protein
VTAQAYSPLTRGYQIDDAAQAAVAAKCALASKQAKAQRQKHKHGGLKADKQKPSTSASREHFALQLAVVHQCHALASTYRL